MNTSLEALIHQAHYAVAFTGAGVSTLSGLPDFRGPRGFYTRPDSARVFDLDLFLTDPTVFYRECRSLLYADQAPLSSLVHNVLADWERQGLLKAIVTQNIDRLHQRAGSQVVWEVHGSPEHHHCLECGQKTDYETVAALVRAGSLHPRCRCGGTFKPDITFFGEALPERTLRMASQEMQRADLVLVLGSSLTVYPAAALPEEALRRGAKIVIVNADPTPLDTEAVLVLRDLQLAFEP